MKITLPLFTFLLVSLFIFAQSNDNDFKILISNLEELRTAAHYQRAIELIEEKSQSNKSYTSTPLILLQAYKAELQSREGQFNYDDLFLKKALASKEIQQNYPAYLARFRMALALFILEQDNYQQAYEVAKQARQDWELVARDTLLRIRIQRHMAFALMMLSIEAEETKKLLEDCLTLIKKQHLEGTNEHAQVLRTTGAIYMEKGDFQTAISYLNKAQKLLDQVPVKDDDLIFTILLQLGNANLYSGDFAQSLKHFQACTALRIKQKPQSFEVGTGYYSIGLAYYFLNQAEKAKENLERALAIFRTNENEAGRITLKTKNWLGNVLLKQQAYGEAIGFLKEGIAKTLEKSVYNKRDLAYNYDHLGLGYLENQQATLALEQFKIAEKLIAENDGKNHPISSIPLTYQSRAYLQMGDGQKALELANRALDILRYTEEIDLEKHPYPTYLLNALPARARAHHFIFMQSGNVSNLVAANIAFMKDIAVIDGLRKGYQDGSQLNLLKNNYSAIEGAIATFFELDQLYPDQNYALQALQVAEGAKARLLQEEQLERWAKFKSAIPDSLLQIEQNLKTNIVQWQQTAFLMEQQQLADSLLKIEGQISGLENQLQDWKNQVQVDYPDFKIYTESQKNSAADFDISLGEQQAVVEFFVGTDALYVFTIRNKGNIKWQKITGTAWANLRQQIKNWQTKITNRQTKLAPDISAALTATFMPFMDAEVKHLLIIPDGILSLFPFEILETDGKMLLEKYTIHYDFSLTLQQKNSKPRTSSATKFLAAYAPQYQLNQIAQVDTFDNQLLSDLVRSGNYYLPGAQKEAQQITDLFEADIYLDTQATERLFLQTAADYQILHLAMHALIEPTDAKFSRLLFSDTTIDSLYDNRLTVVELMNMDLNANLAVLSACNTGYGEIQRGEGIMSLSRAFAYAGVPATVTSLWKVPDQQTYQIMLHFYENLKAGDDKATALKKAKLHFLENATASEFHHPYYWAGFVLTGDVNPIQFHDNNSWLWWAAALIVAILGLFFYKKIKFHI